MCPNIDPFLILNFKVDVEWNPTRWIPQISQGLWVSGLNIWWSSHLYSCFLSETETHEGWRSEQLHPSIKIAHPTVSEAVLLLCQLCFKLGPKLQKQISIEVKGFYGGTKRFLSPVESVFNQLCLGSSLSPALDCFLSAPRVFKALSKCLGIGRVELQFSAISEQNNTSSGTAVFYLCMGRAHVLFIACSAIPSPPGHCKAPTQGTWRCFWSSHL